MNAVINEIDTQERVVWVGYEGVQEELLANLRYYVVQFVPPLRRGRIGIPYRPGMSEAEIQVFAEAAASIIGIWTIRSGITKRIEADFATSFLVVQTNQVRHDSESAEGRQISSWIRHRTATVGGAA